MAQNKEYERFYRENRQRLVSRLASIVDQRSIAEEIAQEAFQTVWQRWNGLREPESYLYRVAHNRANDELRKRRTSRAKAHYFRERESNEHIYLTDALSQVTDRQKTAIYLRYFGDKTHGEVAEIMELPTGTVKSLIHRGLNDLRTCIA